jgi:3-oxoacyl-[acyl-carrier-protein] synthase-1
VEPVVTAVSAATSIGLSMPAIFAALRSSVSGFRNSGEFADDKARPVLVSELPAIAGVSSGLNRPRRLRAFCRFCLQQILATLPDAATRSLRVFLLLGLAAPTRPGPRYRGEADELRLTLEDMLRRQFADVTIRFFESGDPAALEALEAANQLLQAYPNALCVVGGMDSLLDVATLAYLEQDTRLKSASYGRSHGLVAGEAVGMLLVESTEAARSRGRRALARVLSVGIAHEAVPLRSPEPSTMNGLTEACHLALSRARIGPETVGLVLGDLNGEFFRHKEWTFAELRCLGPAAGRRDLWHPADCLGDVGAASGALLVNLAVSLFAQRSQAVTPALCFCSDDGSMRAAAVLAPPVQYS